MTADPWHLPETKRKQYSIISIISSIICNWKIEVVIVKSGNGDKNQIFFLNCQFLSHFSELPGMETLTAVISKECLFLI